MENSTREVAAWTRWLHIYLSMFSFAALLFFAVTGITLNHTDWIEGQQKVQKVNGNLPLNLAQNDSTQIDKLMVVEYLRNMHQIKTPLVEFSTGKEEHSVSFKGPGYSAEGFIEIPSGHYELTITKSGLIAIMNDLHKGRDSGVVWGWLIDISAITMTLVSITGFIMIFYLKKRRFSGLIIASIGAMIILVIYYLFV